MKRVALYVRVSTEEQKKNGLSVDNQIVALTDYSHENGFEIVGVYNDAGLTAKEKLYKRKALLNLVEDCKAHKIDLILFTRLDRWFRNIGDYYHIQAALDENHVAWKAIWEDYETETASGRFKVNIMLSVAQSEVERTSERIKAVFDYKRAKGEAVNGSVATGYVYREGKWYKDKETQKGVEAFFETYLATFNKKMSITAARDLGVHISDETARHMLYGDKYHGILPYVMEPYVTQEQHDLFLANKPKCTRQNKYSYIFTGVVKCGKCGRPLCATTGVSKLKSGKAKYYPSYVCDYGRRNYNCSGSAISEKKLEQILLDTLEKELNDYNLTLSVNQVNDNSNKVRKCKDRLNRIKIMFEMGDIELDEYAEKRNALLSEIESYESIKVKEPICLPSDWKEIYMSLDISHKNSFWKQIIDYIEIPEKKANEVHIFFK